MKTMKNGESLRRMMKNDGSTMKTTNSESLPMCDSAIFDGDRGRISLPTPISSSSVAVRRSSDSNSSPWCIDLCLRFGSASIFCGSHCYYVDDCGEFANFVNGRVWSWLEGIAAVEAVELWCDR